jgi:diguanylate cyclase (GGDEF)-like protein
MYRVIACLTTDHDRWLVVLAALVCIATTLTSFLMYSIADSSTGPRRFMWAALTGVAAGSGVWSTHFVAMLAYKGAMPTNYEPVWTGLSLLIAILIAGAGFVVSTGKSYVSAAFGGLLIGLAIGTMHYTGMTALLIPGSISWDTHLVAASFAFGIVIAGSAIVAFKALTGSRAIITAGLLLALAICVLHFTAMGAVTVVPDPTVEFHESGMNRGHLALTITAVTFIVLICVFSAATVQRANLRYEAVLSEQNALLEAAMRYLPVGLSMFDRDQRLIMCNPAYRKLYGLSEDLTRAGAHYSDILATVARATATVGCAGQLIVNHRQKLDSGDSFSETMAFEDGRTIVKKVGPIAGGGWVDVQEDVTAQREQEARIAHMARHDALTGLPNRAHLLEVLDAALHDARADDGVAVLFLDLDRFKQVNDTLGHLMGDDLLKAVAGRLRDTVRHTDLVARIGGDEFVVVQSSTDPIKESAELASRIIASLVAPFHISGRRVDIGASVGIAVAPRGGIDATALLSRADSALYQTKAAGGTGYCVYGREGEMARALIVYTGQDETALTA